MNFLTSPVCSSSRLFICITFAFAACSTAFSPAASDSSRTDPESHNGEESIASLTLSVSSRRTNEAAPLLHPPPGESVAPIASGLAYIRGPEDHLIVNEEAYLAIDNDPETIWSSKQPAPQWLAIVLSGLQYPVRASHAGDGSGRIFVVEQTERILIFQEGIASEKPLPDVSDRANCCNGERGMFGLALSPFFPDTRLFNLSGSNNYGAATISRFPTTYDPNVADKNTEEIPLTIDQHQKDQYGGHLAFGAKDGYSYNAHSITVSIWQSYSAG